MCHRVDLLALAGHGLKAFSGMGVGARFNFSMSTPPATSFKLSARYCIFTAILAQVSLWCVQLLSTPPGMMVDLPAPDLGMSAAELHGTAISAPSGFALPPPVSVLGMSAAELHGTAISAPSGFALPPPVSDDSIMVHDDMATDAEEPEVVSVSPPDLSCSMWQGRFCCQKGCVGNLCSDPNFNTESVDDFQANTAAMSTMDRRNFFFEILRKMSVNPQTGVVGTISMWTFKGHPVCFEGWLILCDISKNMVRTLLDAIRGGAVTAPPDGRMLRKIRQKPAAESVHAWLEWVYENLAEPLAEGHFREDEAGDTLPAVDNYFNWILGVGCTPGAADFQPQRQQRWLPHCKPADLYQQYRDHNRWHEELKEPASPSVFYQVLKEWRGILRVRSANQHAKCDACTMYKLHRKKAVSESEREEIQHCYLEHLRGMWADRAIAAQYENRSVWSTSADTSVPFDQRVLFLCLDGMDECAYRLPRNTMSKSWSTLWRPSLHNVLVIAYGLTESFFLGDVNLKKDSNCQATVLSHWE